MELTSKWKEIVCMSRFLKFFLLIFRLQCLVILMQWNLFLFISELHGDYIVAEYVNGLQQGTGRTPPAQSSGTDPRSVFSLLGSCNGLVYFACDWEKVLLSNPATRNGYFLPFTLDVKPDNVGAYSSLDGMHKVVYSHGYGSGYVSTSEDYHVVQIVQVFKPEENSLQSQLASYGIRSNSCVEVEFPYILIGPLQTGVFVSGAIHWTVVRPKEDPNNDSEMLIVGFDLGLNEFREVPQPDYTDGESFSLKLGQLGNCLCIFADYKDKFVDVWIMKEYGVKESWSIAFSVPHPELCYSHGVVPMGFSVTGKEVLLQLDGKRLVWYDLKDPKKVAAAEEITVCGLKGNMDAVVCFGSLVSPFPPPKGESEES